MDGAGSAYVTGYTVSTDFPTTAGAAQTTYAGGSVDAFVTKLNADRIRAGLLDLPGRQRRRSAATASPWTPRATPT